MAPQIGSRDSYSDQTLKGTAYRNDRESNGEGAAGISIHVASRPETLWRVQRSCVPAERSQKVRSTNPVSTVPATKSGWASTLR